MPPKKKPEAEGVLVIGKKRKADAEPVVASPLKELKAQHASQMGTSLQFDKILAVSQRGPRSGDGGSSAHTALVLDVPKLMGGIWHGIKLGFDGVDALWQQQSANQLGCGKQGWSAHFGMNACLSAFETSCKYQSAMVLWWFDITRFAEVPMSRSQVYLAQKHFRRRAVRQRP